MTAAAPSRSALASWSGWTKAARATTGAGPGKLPLALCCSRAVSATAAAERRALTHGYTYAYKSLSVY